MQRFAAALVLASTYVIATACMTDTPVASAPPVVRQAPAAPSTTSARVIDENWCGEVIADRDALHALVEQRIAEHTEEFAACAPKGGARTVVTAHIVLNVCGRASLGYESPADVVSERNLCIDRVIQTIPFASIGDMNFWHDHSFVLGGDAQ